ncbi:MAG: hypothetical protein ACI9IA_000935 [Enterobacterales bacterium]|jgi:hypothetical protein
MDYRTISMLAILLTCLTACSTVKTSSDYNKDSDFTSYKTFSWLTKTDSNVASNATVVNQIMDERIRSSINRQLGVQGYQKLDSIADLNINYSVLTQDNVDITSHNTYGGFAPAWGWRGGYGHRGMSVGMAGYSDIEVDNYKSGTLIIDFIDPKTNQLIWRGMGSKRIPSSTTPEKLDKLVNLVVESILKNFPPK